MKLLVLDKGKTKEVETTSDTPVYKAVLVKDGKFFSTFAGSELTHELPFVRLEYTLGSVTTQGARGDGIFCYSSKEAAIAYVNDSSYKKCHPCAILRAYPVSEPPRARGLSNQLNCHAILPVEVVWQEEEPKPEYKFKVGDKVVGTGGSFKGSTYTVKKVEWDGVRNVYLVSEGVGTGISQGNAYEVNLKLVPSRPDSRFKVGDRVKVISGDYPDRVGKVIVLTKIFWAADRGYFGDSYLCRGEDWNYDESWLELAPPEPEWIDVTKECTVKFVKSLAKEGSWVEVRHGSSWLMEMGIDKVRLSNTKGYRIEGTVKGLSGYAYFKILKKA